MGDKNPNCDGGHCNGPGPTRIYALGAGGNLHLCRRCWTHENTYRADRAAQYGGEEGKMFWPILDWFKAEEVER